MKTLLKIAAALIVLVAVIFTGLSIYIGTLDANKYRPQLVQMLDEKTGRKVTLGGPLAFSLGLGGVRVEVQDASISNPSWASRPDMASMGKFELDVGLLPLLHGGVQINKLIIEHADILLETGKNGQHNWDFGKTITQPAVAPTTPPTASGGASMPPLALDIEGLTIDDSQLAMRSADGKISTYSVTSLSLSMQGAGAQVDFKGSANGTPIALTAKTGITDLLSTAAFPFDADLTYGPFHFTAQGTADIDHKRATVDTYKLTAGNSTLTGSESVDWSGAVPVVKGKLASDHIDPADFKMAASGAAQPAATSSSAPASSGPKRMFSDAPLPLSGLKAVDLSLQSNVKELVVGKGTLQNVAATLSIKDGVLTLSPMTAFIGDKKVEADVRLDAAQSPAQLRVGLTGDAVDLGDLQKLGDMAPFMSGQASANIQLQGQGDSMHAIAASLGGVITVTAEKGEIIGNALSGVSSALAAVFNPAGGDNAINCLAVRFIAKNGVLNDNGILIDSAASTVAGKGNVNLGAETVDLTLNAKTKLVDVGGLVPALLVGGTLSDPRYSVNASGVVKNVLNNVLNGNVIVTQNTAVPDIEVPPAGQNACVYTLDHPKAPSSTSVLPSGGIGKAGEKIKDIGNSLVKGLFGQ
ncbi:MAG: AsmA family protein [Alphaproteobacteria bacterium]|nr:AsmA family protein [Alphaproteobacteria bacterium]